MSSATPIMSNSIEERSSAAAGWYSRANSYPKGSSYKVEEKNLVYGVIRSTHLDLQHLTMALFTPNIAIDALGQVLTVQKKDFDVLAGLASQTISLPSTGQFRNLWSVKQLQSDLPIHYVSATKSGMQHTNGVYGHDGLTTKLDPPVGSYKNLPDSLNTIISLSKEADEGGSVQNAAMIAQVKAVINLDA